MVTQDHATGVPSHMTGPSERGRMKGNWSVKEILIGDYFRIKLGCSGRGNVRPQKKVVVKLVRWPHIISE